MEALAEALEGQEGVWGKVACGHLTVGFLIAAWWTLALKSTHQQIHTGATILADSWSTASGTGGQLAALSWTQEGRDGWRRRRRSNED